MNVSVQLVSEIPERVESFLEIFLQGAGKAL